MMEDQRREEKVPFFTHTPLQRYPIAPREFQFFIVPSQTASKTFQLEECTMQLPLPLLVQ